MIEAFKILKGYDSVMEGGDGRQEGFFKLNNGEAKPHTREHSLKLHKLRHTTKKGNMFFTSRIINEWNSLLEQVINSRSINTFKNCYDRHIYNLMRRGKSYHP